MRATSIMNVISRFEDIQAWQEVWELVKRVYDAPLTETRGVREINSMFTRCKSPQFR